MPIVIVLRDSCNTIIFAENFTLMKNWNELSIRDKNDIIRVAVQNGITTLPEIRERYNEFAEGGDTQEDEQSEGNFVTTLDNIYRNINNAIKVYKIKQSRKADTAIRRTTGGAGYVPPVNIPTKQESRKRLYENIDPYGYDNAAVRVAKAIIGNTKEETISDGYMPEVDDLWATYLQIPKSERHTRSKLVNEGHHIKVLPGTYKPTKGNDSGKYYKLNLNEDSKKAIVDEAMGNTYEEGFDISLNPYDNHLGLKRIEKDPINIGQNRVATSYDKTLNLALRDFTVGRGMDNKGDYVSYYDLWDLSPYRISSKDQSFGIGKPFEIYDRIYLDDYYGVSEPTHSTYLPEVIVYGNKKAEGGSIHIAPSKRGTFTAAASKHGMGVQAFASKVLANKDNYSPAMVKKANFALNARHWEHGDGGPLVEMAMGGRLNGK